MSALAKIKKAAAHDEQNRQYDKALAHYARLLDGGAESDEDLDVALYNRAGDLALRVGDVPRAVAYFERAIDLYAAGGFLNNAVALAVKVLRHAPGHLAAHHTLGLLYARKGFRAEARQHLATYAGQMHRAGRADEVRRTLAELVALGTAREDVTAARELLTARAANADEAAALVGLLDAALAPGGAAASTGAPERGAPGASALAGSDVLGAALDGGVDDGLASALPAGGVRWLTMLPGDPSPLGLTALGAAIAQIPADVPSSAALALTPVDVAVAAAPPMLPAPDALETIAPEDFEALDVGVGGFDIVGDVHAPIAFDVASFDADQSATEPLFDLTMPVDPVAAAHVDVMVDPDVVSAAAPTSADALIWLSPATDEEPGGRDDALDLTGIAPERVDAAVIATPLAPPIEADEPTDLGEWLRSTADASSTRLVTPNVAETGDEDADFGAALHAFTTGIARSVDATDRESHYDLGIAFREMGLLGDAVRELQRALAAPGSGLREREALAQCFLDLNRPELALATLEHAASSVQDLTDGTLVGVHYVLAAAASALGRHDDARAWYVRVLAADYGFRDAASRLAALPPPVHPSQ